MTFTARIRKVSHIHRTWRDQNRIQGIVGKTVFRLVSGFEYVSGALTPDEINELRHHPSVQLETSGVTLPAMKLSIPGGEGELVAPMDGPLAYPRDNRDDPIKGVLADGPGAATEMQGFVTEKAARHPNRFTSENNPRRRKAN